MDRLVARTDAAGAVERFDYDAIGNLTRYIDRKGQEQVYTYDTLNRRSQVTYADASTTTYSYDAGNRLTHVVDSVSGMLARTYDNLDRLTSETTAHGTIEYIYDAAGRRTSMTVAGQPPVTYAYDASSRLTRISQGDQVVTIQYDAEDRRTLLTLPNGVSTEYQYDSAGRLTAMLFRNARGVLDNLAYGYDQADQRVAVGGSFAGSGLPLAALTATYDAANRQVALGNRQITYDANGSISTITDPSGTITFTWDARNRLIGVTGPGVTASFTYDAIDRRTSRTVNGSTTQYLYDGLNIVQEVRDGVTINYLTGLDIDEPFVRSGSEFYLADALGSIIALTDAAGNLTARYTYEPFGTTTLDLGASTNPLQFTARENDGTGLYYYRARYYHPGLHRFISEDPIGFAGGDINLYAYVWNNPVNLTDPGGEAIVYRLPPGCRPNPPPASGRKDLPGADSEGQSNSLGDLYRHFNCDPSNWIPGPGLVKGPTPGMIRHFEQQLVRHGRPAVEKSLRTLQKRLAEHLQKLAKFRAEGGPTSAAEREIRNFQGQIDAIKQVLGR